MQTANSGKGARWTFYISGGVLVAAGVLMLLEPLVAVVSLAFLMGIGLVLAGINELFGYFSMRKSAACPGWVPLLGILDIVVGMLLITRVGLAVFTITTLFGAWVLLAGALRVTIALKLRGAGANNWQFMLLMGVLMLLAALVLFVNPGVAVFTVAFMAAITLIAVGCLMIFEGKILFPPR